MNWDDLPKARRIVNRLKGERATAKRNCKIEQEELIKTEQHLADATEAQEAAQIVAQAIQQQAHTRIAGVVTKCLQTVFTGPDTYAFKINFERKRGRTEAELLLLKNGHEIKDPLNADSGGVVDVAAFALRLACLVLAKPKLRKVVILDEPFKFVSREYRENVRLLLEKLAEDFGIQFIMVTHIEELKTGKVVEL